MIDLSQFGLPCEVEAYGCKWILLYRVGASKNPKRAFYIAIRADAEIPAQTELIEAEA